MLPAIRLAAVAAWALSACPAWAQATPTMDALVARALERVPALASVRATARAQRAREGVAGAAYWPQVALAAGYSRLQGVYPAPFNGAPLDTGAANVTLRQTLFNFGQTDAQVAVARATAEASDAQVGQTAVLAAYAVRRAYLQWAQARAFETQSLAQVKNAGQLRAKATSFFRHGARPRIDVTRAEVVLAQAEAALVDARNQVELARRALETAVGGEPVAGSPAFPAEPALASAPPEALRALARRVHPALRAGRAQRRVAEAGEQVAERLAMPDLSALAVGGMRAQGLQTAPDWQAGVNLSMPLFTGFSIQRQQEAAAEVARAATADLADRELQVLLGVDQARIALTGARQKLVALNVALRSAQENEQLARHRYRDGVGSILEVSEAQTLLATAEGDVVRGKSHLHLAIAELERAIGLTGLEPETKEF